MYVTVYQANQAKTQISLNNEKELIILFIFYF